MLYLLVYNQGGKSRLLYFFVLLGTSWYFLVLFGTFSYFSVLSGYFSVLFVLFGTFWYFSVLFRISSYFSVLLFPKQNKSALLLGTEFLTFPNNRTLLFCFGNRSTERKSVLL